VKQFANFYLTPEEYGLWEYAKTISHNSGVFYFDGPMSRPDWQFVSLW
jgi:hypothetical protein